MASDENEKILTSLDTEGFHFFDQKGLGTVSPEDITKAIERTRTHLPAPEFQGLPDGQEWKTDLEIQVDLCQRDKEKGIRLKMMISEFDGDLDGRLTHSEFKSFIDKSSISDKTEAEPSLVTKQLREVFDMFDTDKDGFIDKNDLKIVMDCMEGEEADSGDIADMINKISSEEGKVSFDDFLTIFKDEKGDEENIEDLILNDYDEL